MLCVRSLGDLPELVIRRQQLGQDRTGLARFGGWQAGSGLAGGGDDMSRLAPLSKCRRAVRRVTVRD